MLPVSFCYIIDSRGVCILSMVTFSCIELGSGVAPSCLFHSARLSHTLAQSVSDISQASRQLGMLKEQMETVWQLHNHDTNSIHRTWGNPYNVSSSHRMIHMKINIVLPQVLPAWSSSWKSDAVYVMYSLLALNCFIKHFPSYYETPILSDSKNKCYFCSIVLN